MELYKHLHDKTLSKIELDWRKGSLTVHLFSDFTQQIFEISGSDVTDCSYSRKFPWGKSICVNKVTVDQISNESTLTIEMQSGDLLVFKGVAFSIAR